MDKNKFDLSNIIRFNEDIQAKEYQRAEKSLKRFLDYLFKIEMYFNSEDKWDTNPHKRVVLTIDDYIYVSELCKWLNINITDYSPIEYYLSKHDDRYISYSNRLGELPNKYFEFDNFKKLRRRVIKELMNRKLIQFNLDKKTFRVTPEDYFKIICQFCSFSSTLIL